MSPDVDWGLWPCEWDPKRGEPVILGFAGVEVDASERRLPAPDPDHSGLAGVEVLLADDTTIWVCTGCARTKALRKLKVLRTTLWVGGVPGCRRAR